MHTDNTLLGEALVLQIPGGASKRPLGQLLRDKRVVRRDLPPELRKGARRTYLDQRSGTV